MDYKKALFNNNFFSESNYDYVSKFFDTSTSSDDECMSKYNVLKLKVNHLHFPTVLALMLLCLNGQMKFEMYGIEYKIKCSVCRTTDFVTSILEIDDSVTVEKQMCVINKNTHTIVALNKITSFDGKSIVTTPYHLYDEKDRKARKRSTVYNNGLVIILAMLPLLIQDKEFKLTFANYKRIGVDKLFDDLFDAYSNSRVFNNELQIALFVCSDNIYRRIKFVNVSKDCEQFVINGPDENDASVRINDIEIFRSYISKKAEDNFIGDFVRYSVTKPKKSKSLKVSELPAKYNFGYKVSKDKEVLIPKLEDWYVIPKELERILIAINAYKNRNSQFQNILLYGRAGTGKSKMAEAIAYALQLPYYPINLNPNTDEVQLTGTYAPNVNSTSNDDMYIPSLQEIELDPVGVYKKLTGVVDKDVTEYTAYQKLVEMLQERKRNNSSDFIVTQTPLVEAVRNGGLIELQELTLVKDPAMLGMLNSLMDCENPFLTVPQTGETIKRHPACVIVGTTNVDYAGCRPLNIATKDRFKLHFKLENPKQKDILERVKKKCTLFPDDSKNSTLKSFVSAFCEIVKLREANEEEDSATMRALYDWVDYYSALYGVITPFEASEDTIINRLSFDEEEQLEAKAILQKYF